MRLRDDVAVKKVGEEFYIVPYSSAQAYRISGVRLNEFGAFLAKQMECEITERALIELASIHTGEKKETIAGDVHYFTKSLSDLCIDEKGDGSLLHLFRDVKDEAVYLEIAGIKIIFNEDRKLLKSELMSFRCDPFPQYDCDLFISFEYEDRMDNSGWQTVYETEDAGVFENYGEYLIYYRDLQDIDCIEVSADYGSAVFYVDEDWKEDSIREDIYLSLRSVFLLAALKDRKVALHCCACLDKYGAFLLSGHSGAGKSTLSDLILANKYSVAVINGDLALLGTEDGVPYVYGIPWCGTSGLYTVFKNVLSSVTFIRKSDDNIVERVDNGSHSIDFMNRIITPVWNERMLDAKLTSGMTVLRDLPLYRYYFRKEKKAGMIFYERRIADNTGIQ